MTTEKRRQSKEADRLKEKATSLDAVWYLKADARMLRIRAFEKKAADCFMKRDPAGNIYLYTDEEASGEGTYLALRESDFIRSIHRGHGHCITKNAADGSEDGQAVWQGDRLLPPLYTTVDVSVLTLARFAEKAVAKRNGTLAVRYFGSVEGILPTLAAGETAVLELRRSDGWQAAADFGRCVAFGDEDAAAFLRDVAATRASPLFLLA